MTIFALMLSLAAPATTPASSAPSNAAAPDADARTDTPAAAGSTGAQPGSLDDPFGQRPPARQDGERDGQPGFAPPSGASASGLPIATPPAAAPRPAAAPAKPSAAASGARPSAPRPLPAPPPAADVGDIEADSWRGKGYFAASLTLGGPLGGSYPAAGNVVAFGGGVEAGFRLHPMVALGFGVQAAPHAVVETYLEFENDLLLLQARPTLVTWDFLVGRLYWPTAGKFQPFLVASGGIASFELFPVEAERIGGHVRSGLGFERWISPTVGLEASLDYRAVFLQQTVGHQLQGRFAVVVHW